MLSRVLLVSAVLGTALPVTMLAQQSAPAGVTVAKPQTDKQKKANDKKLKKELETPYKKWLNEEVVWIISEEERTAFGRLQTDDERQQFIEQFWLRRDPTPDTEENEFKEEHYRRIAWANDRFASGIPGWKTDRGMIYIKYGAPDEKEEHPTGGPGNRDIEEGGGQTTFFPYERWRYRYMQGLTMPQDVTLEFVDQSMTNEYKLTWNPSDKDALLRVPGAGLTLYEQMGLADKTDRFTGVNGGMPNMGIGPMTGTSKNNMFDALQRYTDVQKAPPIKFKDLDAVVNSTIKYNLLPMQVRVDYIPVTETAVIASITIQFNREDLQFKQKDRIAEATVNIRSSISTITRKPVGRPIENTVTVQGPAEELAALQTGRAIYNTTTSLLPGKYKLTIVAKDAVGDNMTSYDVALDVPAVEEDELGTSSLILADLLERVDTRSTGQGQFVIGTTKVRPRVDEIFKRNETLGFFMQLYNFEPDEATHKPEGTVTYEIVRNGTNEVVQEFTEEVSKLRGGASQMTIEKKLKLEGFEPGEYTLRVKVTDAKRNESLTPSVKFKVI
jgi:GWxTD domain-containing protein